MTAREKGNATQRKAIRYGLSFPGSRVLVWRQPAWFPEEQLFDLLILRESFWPRFVEVRTKQWRTGRASTVALAMLPGEGYRKQIWRWRARVMTPDIREWDGRTWHPKLSPWEE